MTTLAPVIALSHGGGPMPLLGDEGHKDIIYSLTKRVPKLLGLGTPSAPRAIVLVTAHWQTSQPSISSAKSPSLYYDYGGFPPETYQLKYPAPGEPDVAQDIRAALKAEGISSVLDEKRGWDHGVFVPMLLVHPKADVPIVQMSILESEDAAAHLRIGAALSRLRASNIAIVGSGFASFHNGRIMRQLMGAGPAGQAQFRGVSDAWNSALTEVVTRSDKKTRLDGLTTWRELPNADLMHAPGSADHFMPLLVCAGAAGEEKANFYKDEWMGIDIITYYWGPEAIL